MSSDPYSDARIVESWRKNASPWTLAVRERQIETRSQITDQAIIDAVIDCSPRTVLDIGCGEGWLVRELVARNIQVIGVDAVPELIEQARRAGAGDYRALSYEEIAEGKLEVSVDVIVSNFALLGKESVEGIFRTVPSLLNAQGSLIVQTLHPVTACGDLPYHDGWRAGSWAGFSPAFTDPAPWYFRTLQTWKNLFTEAGLRVREVREPCHPQTQEPASVIFIGELVG